MFKWLFCKKNVETELSSVNEVLKTDNLFVRGVPNAIKLADVKQSINGVTQLPTSSIDQMVELKHDLNYQLSLCRELISEGNILPFPFERAVVLLRKEKRYEEELEICLYIAQWCEDAKNSHKKGTAMIWESPTLRKCMERIPKIKSLLEKPQ